MQDTTQQIITSDSLPNLLSNPATEREAADTVLLNREQTPSNQVQLAKTDSSQIQLTEIKPISAQTRVAEKPVIKSAKQISIQRELFKADTVSAKKDDLSRHPTDSFAHINWNKTSALIFEKKPENKIWRQEQTLTVQNNELKFLAHDLLSENYNWTIIIGLISFVLLIFLKFYYQKFMTKVMNTLVNFQLADNMLREKNIIVRRAFFVMNVNFILVISLFILLIVNTYDYSLTDKNSTDYFLIALIVLGVVIARLIVLHSVGFLLEWRQAVVAHIHNIYLVNKNLGILLLPIVFAAIFSSPIISKILITIGIGLFLAATLFKIIRGFQIIIRNGVLIFYAILYLCTLELLPLFVGMKFIVLLR